MKQIFKKITFFLIILIVSLFSTSNVFAVIEGKAGSNGIGFDDSGFEGITGEEHWRGNANVADNGLRMSLNYRNEVEMSEDYLSDDDPDKNINLTLEDDTQTYTRKYAFHQHLTDYKKPNSMSATQYFIYCIDVSRSSGGSSAQFKVLRDLDQNDPLDAAVLYILSFDDFDSLIPKSENSPQAHVDSYDAQFSKHMALRALVIFQASDFRRYSNVVEEICNSRAGLLWALEDPNRYIVDIFNAKNGENFNKNVSKDVYQQYVISHVNDDTSGTGIWPLTQFTNYSLNEKEPKVQYAKKLFLQALKYGAEVAKGGHKFTKNVDITKPNFTKSEFSTEAVRGNFTGVCENSSDSIFSSNSFNRDKEKYSKYFGANNGYNSVQEKSYLKTTKEVEFSVTFTDFTKNDKSGLKNITVKNTVNPCEIYLETGDLLYYDTTSSSWKKFNATQINNILNTNYDNGNKQTTLNFKYTIAAYLPDSMINDVDESIKVDVSITVDYEDESSFTGALIYNAAKGGEYSQRFYIYEKDKSQHRGQTGKLSWNLANIYCASVIPNTSNTEEFKKYLKICCRGENSSEFSIHKECETSVNNKKTEEEKKKERQSNEWCKKEQLYCSVCDGTISVPQVCSEFGEDGVPKCDDNADAVIKDNDNIKLCVLDYSDLAKNDYKMTTDDNVASNDYCTVYCKEDYRFSLPLGRWVSPGRSFTVGLNASATKTCYTDLINYDKFVADLNANKRLLDINVNDVKARTGYAKAIKQYKTCAEASWNSEIKFDPQISIKYDEKEYIEKFKDGKLDFKVGTTKDGSTLKVSNDNKWLCNGTDVDDYYNVCKNGLAVNDPTTTTTETFSGYYDPNTFAKTNITVPKTRFAKKVSFASAVYVPKDNLYVQAGTGVVHQSATVDLQTYQKLATDLEVNGEIIDESGQLPISLKRETGMYKFNIEFAGIGEFFNSGKTGRFVGDKNSVALADGKATFKGEYICSYTVNCPECSTEGFIPPFDREIEINNPPTPDDCIVCSVEPACINYCDNSNGIFIARQISLNNVKPTDRAYGINFAGLKGITAVSDIEDHGSGNAEAIYNGKAEYSITLTPSETRKLQQYNNVKLNSGGYTSFDDFECMKYSDYIGKNSEYYEKIKDNDYLICTSKLLRNNVSGYELKNVEISDNKNYSWIEACDKETNSKCFMGGFYGPAYK